jgi:hypothetical protein
MIRKLRSGEYRLYSRKVNPKTGKRRNLGTFKSRAAAEKHERDVQYFKRHYVFSVSTESKRGRSNTLRLCRPDFGEKPVDLRGEIARLRR